MSVPGPSWGIDPSYYPTSIPQATPPAIYGYPQWPGFSLVACPRCTHDGRQNSCLTCGGHGGVILNQWNGTVSRIVLLESAPGGGR